MLYPEKRNIWDVVYSLTYLDQLTYLYRISHKQSKLPPPYLPEKFVNIPSYCWREANLDDSGGVWPSSLVTW
jgi:hypothetical protein